MNVRVGRPGCDRPLVLEPVGRLLERVGGDNLLSFRCARLWLVREAVVSARVAPFSAARAAARRS